MKTRGDPIPTPTATVGLKRPTVLFGMRNPGVWTNDAVSRGRLVVARARRPRRCWRLPCARARCCVGQHLRGKAAQVRLPIINITHLDT